MLTDDTDRTPSEPPASHLDGDAAFNALRDEHLTEPFRGGLAAVRARFVEPVRAAYPEARHTLDTDPNFAAFRRRIGC